MTLTSTCAGRTCTLDAGIPTGVTSADAGSVVYTWNIGGVATMAGTNLRRQTIMFGSPASITVTVTATRGTTVVARTAVSVSVR